MVVVSGSMCTYQCVRDGNKKDCTIPISALDVKLSTRTYHSPSTPPALVIETDMNCKTEEPVCSDKMTYNQAHVRTAQQPNATERVQPDPARLALFLNELIDPTSSRPGRLGLEEQSQEEGGNGGDTEAVLCRPPRIVVRGHTAYCRSDGHAEENGLRYYELVYGAGGTSKWLTPKKMPEERPRSSSL